MLQRKVPSSTANRVVDAADQPLGLAPLRSAPVRRRSSSVRLRERHRHLPPRHVQMRRSLVGQRSNSGRRNNSVEHKSRQQEEPPSNARPKNARHNSGVKRRNRQGRRRSGLERKSRPRNARAWTSSVEPLNRIALAQQLNSSVPTNAGKQQKSNAQPGVRRSSAGVPMNSVRRSKGGRLSAPARRYGPEPISRSRRGMSSYAKSG